MGVAKPVSSSKSALLWIATVSIFVYGMVASVAGTIVPQLSARMHFMPGQIGEIFLAQAVGMMCASLAAGPLVDSQGKKAGMLVSLGLVTLALLNLPGSSSLRELLVFMGILGLGGGSLTTTASVLLSEINPERRAAILTITKSSYGMGGFLTPLIGATLVSGNTIRLCYLIAALAGALFVSTVFVVFPAASSRGFQVGHAGPLFRQPLLCVLSLAMFFYVACEVGMFNWLPNYLIAQGLPDKSALAVVSVGFALGLLIGRLAFAAVLLRVPVHVVTVASAVVMAIMTSLLIGIQGVTAATIVIFIAGLAMAPVFPSIVAMVGNCFPDATATAMGIAITSGWVGLATSSQMIGMIANKAPGGLRTGMLVLPVFSTILILLTAILWMWPKKLTAAQSTNNSKPALPTGSELLLKGVVNGLKQKQ